MSKASCCCGLNSSAAAGSVAAARSAIRAVKKTIQKRLPEVRFLRIRLSQGNAAHPYEFRQGWRSLASYPDQAVLRLCYPYLISFAAITSISTRNPGLASAATPTTDRAGRLG